MLLRFSLVIIKDEEIEMIQLLDHPLVHPLMKPPPQVDALDLTGPHHHKEIVMDSLLKKLKRQQRKLDGLMKKKLKKELELVGGKNRKRKKIIPQIMI